jgi:hypothetical protein
MRQVGERFLFTLLCTTILVFFSEKAYWYIYGYKLFDLLLYYFFPAFVLLWVVQTFRVCWIAPLFLCGAVYGFLAEGVIVTQIYEGGFWDWFHVSYAPLGWHAPFSVVFGLFLLRRLLLRGSYTRLVLGAASFGVFWGSWSLVYWIPKSEGEAVRGLWSVPSFALYAFTFAALLAVCHWLLGQGLWQCEFKPTRVEKFLVGLAIVAYFAFVTVPKAHVALIKLPVFLLITFAALWVNGRAEQGITVLEELRGRVNVSRAASLLAMPLAATLVYWAAKVLNPSHGLIRSVFYLGIVMTTAYAGMILFVVALVVCFWRGLLKAQPKSPHVGPSGGSV